MEFFVGFLLGIAIGFFAGKLYVQRAHDKMRRVP